jgi:hypothetical protein
VFSANPSPVEPILLGMIRGALVVLAVVTLAALMVLNQTQDRAEHRDPSYRYGKNLMLNQIYQGSGTGSVRDACEAAIGQAAKHRHRAVDGCVDQERLLDD